MPGSGSAHTRKREHRPSATAFAKGDAEFIDDSFTRFIVQDHGRLLFKMMCPGGFTGAAHERATSGDRTCTVFDIAKFTRPGVEVLPGEPKSRWREVIAKWIGYIPRWPGLKDGFKTDRLRRKSQRC